MAARYRFWEVGADKQAINDWIKTNLQPGPVAAEINGKTIVEAYDDEDQAAIELRFSK